MDGMRPTLLSYSCEVRSEYIVDGEACAEAFRHCCKIMESELEERKEDHLILARSKKHRQNKFKIVRDAKIIFTPKHLWL